MKKKLVVISSLIILIMLVVVIALVFNFNGKNKLSSAELNNFAHHQIITSIEETQTMDLSKPLVVLFYANYCKTCHEFMPAFKKLSKDFKNEYNFLVLNIEDPKNYALAAGNVGGVPTLCIFDTSIGNKVHISIASVRSYNELKAELERYLKFRSYLDLERAQKDHEKELEKIAEQIRQQQDG